MVSIKFFLMIRRPPISSLLPYTTLSLSADPLLALGLALGAGLGVGRLGGTLGRDRDGFLGPFGARGQPLRGEDRKSTCLNSSHANISYAVFCLKKKRIWQRHNKSSATGL